MLFNFTFTDLPALTKGCLNGDLNRQKSEIGLSEQAVQQKLLLRRKPQNVAPIKLAFNMFSIDVLFPGFKAGDFAMIYGPQMVTSLVAHLCVIAQLPQKVGGLSTKVVFIDAANSSSLPDLAEAAKNFGLNPQTALGNVISMRAYTAYRLTTLIMEKLEKNVSESDAKLVVISDIAGSFLNDNVDDQEAKAVYSQISNYLASFAKKHKIVIIATHLSHENSRRNRTLQEIAIAKANTVLKFTKTPYTSDVELEKHPTYMLGVAEFVSEIKPLADFKIITQAPVLSYNILQK